ncbi:MAG TPA: hypothetical protein VEJ20_08355, partial [Candidatus Eremiobacteraceae bacterium]|nr:hypothetical protein [Candidatus Eremiobacteraceae bacterium]
LPAAVIGASTSRFGTVRMQFQMRQAAVAMDMPVLTSPQIYVSQAPTKFNDDGTLNDEALKGQITELISELAKLARRHNVRSRKF